VLHRLARDDRYAGLHAAIRALAEASGFAVLEPLAHLAGRPAEAWRVRPTDHRPSEFAHAVAARRVSEWIESPASARRSPPCGRGSRLRSAVSPPVLVIEQRDHVALWTLNRPEALNALDTELLTALGDAGRQANASPDVRAIVITGAGRAFCSGGDVKGANFASGVGSAGDSDPASHWAAQLLAIRKPTLAAINGVAAGGGLSLALGCDIRIASEQARFSAIFARIGMSVLDGCGWLLPRAVGISKALELLYTAELIDAAEAQRIGIVGRVVPHAELLPSALALAARIAAQPPVALELSKRVVLGSSEKSFLEHLPIQWAAQRENAEVARHDIEEGVRAFREKRPARFRGRSAER
jgi:2-(1,2-epoxy-1,2-dihydrophenyl)acetyl-CoA isomerase